ncbi:hypothetical protein PENSPDRAFT_41341 [Peniophora sp. CONT]|nr:hypothetical protein PENSPDRAFT_41341 [Peniophora sp. CONT]
MSERHLFLNLTRRERGGFRGRFRENIYRNYDAIQESLSQITFPSELPENILTIPAVPRSHLGTLSALPAELIDAIFEQLSVLEHVARFAAAHPMLGQRGFVRVVQIRSEALRGITWCRSRVALVGDEMYCAQDHAEALPDDVLADYEKRDQALQVDVSEDRIDADDLPSMTLYEFAEEQFEEVDYSSLGPRRVLEYKEMDMVNSYFKDDGLSWRKWISERRMNDRDWQRVDSILEHAQPSFPCLKTARLCNLTKRQFVRAEALRTCWVRRGNEVWQLSIGTTALFLTVCTDHWGFAPPYLKGPQGEMERKAIGMVMGRWAGDCIAVVGTDDGELEGMIDISADVVEKVGRFVELDAA